MTVKQPGEGYLLIEDTLVRPARDLDELVGLVVRATRRGARKIDARVRLTLTRDRRMTAAEQRELVDRTTERLTRG